MFIRLVFVCTAVPQKSLGQEVNELATSQLLRLEKENQMLLKTVEEMKASCERETLLRLEKDNQMLSQKVRQISLTVSDEINLFVNLELNDASGCYLAFNLESKHKI